MLKAFRVVRIKDQEIESKALRISSLRISQLTLYFDLFIDG